jgi:tetratricopeptide (TPR) repeat protein
LEDPEAIAIVMTHKGAAYAALGEPQSSLECLRKAFSASEKVGDQRGIAVALGNLGRAYAALREPHIALRHYLQALDKLEDIGDQEQSPVLLHNIGRAYLQIGNMEKSLESLIRAESILRDSGDRLSLGRTLSAIGRACVALGDPMKALVQYYPEARAILEEMGDLRGMPELLVNIGDAHKSLGEFDEALDCYSKARSRVEMRGNEIFLREILNLIGVAWVEKLNKLVNTPVALREAQEAFYHALQSFELAGNEEMITALNDAIAGPYRNQPFSSARKPGRNSLCPCGSRKKYKRCCGRD